MNVPGSLQTHLGVGILLLDIRLARNADRHELIANGDSHSILVVAVQNDRISRRNEDAKYLHVIIVQDQMMVGLVVHRRHDRCLRNKQQR